MTSRRSWPAIAATVLVALVFWWLQSGEAPRDAAPTGDQPGSSSGPAAATDPVSGLRWVDLADLPPEAADTVDLIDAGGPYPEDEDGGVFGNFEGLLPERPRGYYREYTVQTPGSDTRGARRIVAGSQGELYWTADHYESFERIRP